MAKVKPITMTENRNDAREARRQMLATGVPVELWEYPREFVQTGQNPIFDSPEALWDAACEYFKWAKDAELEYQVELGRNTGQMVKVKKPRPFHIKAFFALCGITKSMWDRIKSKPEFDQVVENIEDIIYMQKFDGGMIGVFDAGMTSKDLGLTDKRELTADVNANVSNVSARDVLLARLQRGETDA